MVKIEFSNSTIKNCRKSIILDDYRAERMFWELSNGRINPALLNEGLYMLTNLSVQDENGMIYDTAKFIP